MKRVILLILSIVLSCLSYLLLNKGGLPFFYNFLGNFGPGFFYSIFLLSISEKTSSMNIIETFLTYVLLVVLWFISFCFSFISWGILIPIFGGLSAWIICRYILFIKVKRKILIRYTVLGTTISLLGLVLFYALKLPGELFEAKIVLIFVLWQIAIGIKTIRIQNRKKYL